MHSGISVCQIRVDNRTPRIPPAAAQRARTSVAVGLLRLEDDHSTCTQHNRKHSYDHVSIVLGLIRTQVTPIPSADRNTRINDANTKSRYQQRARKIGTSETADLTKQVGEIQCTTERPIAFGIGKQRTIKQLVITRI